VGGTAARPLTSSPIKGLNTTIPRRVPTFASYIVHHTSDPRTGRAIDCTNYAEIGEADNVGVLTPRQLMLHRYVGR